MSELLRASDLRFSYGDVEVLRGVDVDLSRGEVVGLIGANGSGKSTLMRVLLGQLEMRATRQEIVWEGTRIANWQHRELARRVAYLPQSASWDVEQRVADVLRLGRAPYWSAFGIESQKDVEVVQEVARQLGLIELLIRRMDELSGGQRQRVFVGRCLVQEPVAMLLDEPNTFLDVKHQVELGNLLRRLAKEKNVGVLLASHDLNLAGAMVDRLVLLHEGKVLAHGTPDEVLRPEYLSAAYGVQMERVERVNAAPVVIPVLAPDAGR